MFSGCYEVIFKSDAEFCSNVMVRSIVCICIFLFSLKLVDDGSTLLFVLGCVFAVLSALITTLLCIEVICSVLPAFALTRGLVLKRVSINNCFIDRVEVTDKDIQESLLGEKATLLKTLSEDDKLAIHLILLDTLMDELKAKGKENTKAYNRLYSDIAFIADCYELRGATND